MGLQTPTNRKAFKWASVPAAKHCQYGHYWNCLILSGTPVHFRIVAEGKEALAIHQEMKMVLESLGILGGISMSWDLSKIRLGQLKCCSCCLDEWHWNSSVHVHSLQLLLCILSGRPACFLCKELTLFLRRIIQSPSDTLTFLVRLIKLLLPQLEWICCAVTATSRATKRIIKPQQI